MFQNEPLKLFYQILVTSPDVPATADASITTIPETASVHSHSKMNIISGKSSLSCISSSEIKRKTLADNGPITTHIEKNLDDFHVNENQLHNLKMLSDSALMDIPSSPLPPTPMVAKKSNIDSSISRDSSINSMAKNCNNNYHIEYKEDSNNRYSISTDHPAKPTKVTIVKNSNNNNHSKSSSVKSPSTTTKQRASTDFKSLRSNDYKFSNDFADTKSDMKSNKPQSLGGKASGSKDSPTPSNYNEMFGTMKKPDDCKMSVSKACAAAAITSPNIVVSIPQCRRSSLSDENFASLSFSTLKTANKKTKSSIFKTSVSVDETLLRRYAVDDIVPKLKITVPKETSDSKSQVDFAEIANYIGLKRKSPEPAADAASPPYERHSSDRSSHKKRKKSGKHSREPGSGKRRKLHAEISSQEEESLKLKVKITGSKPSKHERKNSSNSSSGEDSLGAKKSLSPDIVVDANCETPTKESLSELRKVRIKNAKSVSPDKDVVITKVTYPSLTKVPASTSAAISSKTSSYSSQPTFAIPKQPESKQKMAPPSTPPPKTYLPGMKTMSRPQIPDVRPYSNSNRMFSPTHTPSYHSFNDSKVQQPSPRLIPISGGTPHSATLKRSMSVDTRPVVPLAKQTKMELFNRKIDIPNLIRTSGVRVQNRSPSTDNRQSPATSKPAESHYNSAMSSTYTREITTKKPAPILLPPSSISVTKMTDVPQPSMSNSTATVTRPALEIVRISSSAPTADQQHNMMQKNTALQLSPQPNRPPQQTIPLMKIKKVGMASGQTSFQNLNNSTKTTERKSPAYNPMCDFSGVLDLSSGNIRSPSAEKIQNIPSQSTTPPALVTPRKKNTTPPIAIIDITTPTKSPTQSPTKPINEQKQTEQRTSPPEYTSQKSVHQAGKFSSDQKNDVSVPKQMTGKDLPSTWMIAARHRTTEGQSLLDQKLSNLKQTEQQLQNLKMLSATVLAGNKSLLQPSSAMPKLNEIGSNRIARTPPVRQQNASVRNIPNPSALAFRHQTTSPRSVSPSITSTSSPTISSTSVPYTAQKTGSSNMTAQKNTPLSCTTTATTSKALTSLYPHFQSDAIKALNFSGNVGNFVEGSNDPKLIAAKKNMHIEQVAATLLAAAVSDSGSTVTT